MVCDNLLGAVWLCKLGDNMSDSGYATMVTSFLLNCGGGWTLVILSCDFLFADARSCTASSWSFVLEEKCSELTTNLDRYSNGEKIYCLLKSYY